MSARVPSRDGENAYQAVRRALLDQIIGGKFPAGARFHSVREVARWPGSTAHLAQRALQELCREGYLESVPKKGLFVRGAARRVRPQASGAKLLLFIVPPGAQQSRVNEMLPGISQVLDPANWRMEVVFLQPDYNQNGGFQFAELLISRHPNAIVWAMPGSQDMLMIRYLVASGVPLVTYNRDFSQTGAMGVVADVSDVARKLFEVIWNEGRRQLACIHIDKQSPSIQQFAQTIRTAAEEHGLGNDFCDVTLPYDELTFPTQEVYDAIATLMSGNDRPDGILCAESFSLLALELWLADNRDVRVPEDLSVASFDRVRLDEYIRVIPPIHTADFDQPAMMAAAMEMIEQQLCGHRLEKLVRVVPAVLVPPPARRRMTAAAMA
jgi:DNA-binding LacI/PurR family transcriptional regulator